MRIIAGTARGRNFAAPEGRSARPTLDRVREAVFGMIQFDIEGRKVLDLFAGSGALGMEALSRGAASAVFCDKNKSSAELVSKNLKALDFSEKAEVFCCDAVSLLKQFSFEQRRFSLVFLDPPYASDLIGNVLPLMIEYDLLQDGCIIIAEHERKSPVAFVHPQLYKKDPRFYGETAVTLMRFEKQ